MLSTKLDLAGWDCECERKSLRVCQQNVCSLLPSHSRNHDMVNKTQWTVCKLAHSSGHQLDATASVSASRSEFAKKMSVPYCPLRLLLVQRDDEQNKCKVWTRMKFMLPTKLDPMGCDCECEHESLRVCQCTVKAQTSLAPLSWFHGSCLTTAHVHQCCIFQSYAKTVPSRMKLTMREPAFMGSMTTDTWSRRVTSDFNSV